MVLSAVELGCTTSSIHVAVEVLVHLLTNEVVGNQSGLEEDLDDEMEVLPGTENDSEVDHDLDFIAQVHALEAARLDIEGDSAADHDLNLDLIVRVHD